MVCAQASLDPCTLICNSCLGKHDGCLPTSAELSEGKGIDLFYTALQGDTHRKANCSSIRKSILKPSLQIRIGCPERFTSLYSKRDRSVNVISQFKNAASYYIWSNN